METYKSEPFKERKSQKLTFLDYAKENLFWAFLPLLTGGAAMLVGKVTKWKVWPLDGSKDLLTTIYAKVAKHFSKDEEIVKWIEEGMWPGHWITQFGGKNKEEIRKYFFNFVKGSEVAAPLAAYVLWHKKEGNRLDLQEVSDKLKNLQDIKPSDAELAEQNTVMRKELAFEAKQASSPLTAIDDHALEHHGKLTENPKHKAAHTERKPSSMKPPEAVASHTDALSNAKPQGMEAFVR